MSDKKLRGKSTITSDDCIDMGFTLVGNEEKRNYKFVKAGKESWVETVKYSHRNVKDIIVTDQGTTVSDGSYVPTDIHDA